MADIVSEIIDDIQSDIDSGYYDLDNFDLNEAIWETLDNKLIYTSDIIEYWESTNQDSISEISGLMSQDITDHVTGSISDADFNFPDDFTANRSHRANRKSANTEFIETVELGGGFSADIWFEPIGEFTGETEYIYEVYKDGEAIAIGSTSTFDEAVSKAEFSAFNAEDYMSGGYGFDRSSHRSSRRVNRRRMAHSRSRTANRAVARRRYR